MKLKITDDFWAVGKKTRRVKTVYAPLEVGQIKDMGDITTWYIDEVSEEHVKISVIRHDGETIKTWKIKEGKGEFWHPRSFDAGHEYTIKLVRFF